MDEEVLNAVAVAVSIVLSLYAAGKQWLSGREASVSGRLERAEVDHGMYLVLTNYGPHWADEVNARPEGREGGASGLVYRHQMGGDDTSESTNLTDDEGRIVLPDLPLERLHTNEPYYIYGFFLPVGAHPGRLVLTWKDGRIRRQRRTVRLSVQPA
jgi:hypothetical protein